MNYRLPAGRLFCKVLLALACMSLAGGMPLAQEMPVKDTHSLALTDPSASPAPAGQELPNLESILNEPPPAQPGATKTDASSRNVNQGAFEIYGPTHDTPMPILTMTVNPGDHTIGNWHIRPILSTTVTYDDNIFISSVNRQADLFTTISPGVAVGWGDFKPELLTATPYEHPFQLVPDNLQRRDYFFARGALNENLFEKNGSLDSLNEDFLLDTQFEFSKLTLGLKGSIQTLSNADIQLGTRVHRTISNAELDSKYSLGEKASLTASFNATTNNYQGAALNSTELANGDFFNYAVNEKFSASIGARISYLAVEQSPAQVGEQILCGATYQPGPKSGISANFGVEFRQVNGGPGFTDGVFNISANYQPFDGTTLTLTVSRSTQGSPDLAGQDETVTRADAEIHQRLFQKFYLVVSTGYSHDVYRDILTLATQRTDDYVYVTPRILFDVNRWASLQFSVEFQSNQSTSSFGFIDHMAMFQCNIVF